jgi:hypothetical protein
MNIGGLLIVAALTTVIVLGLRWFSSTPPQRVAGTLRRIGIFAVVAVIALLTATGRLPWLLTLASALFALLIRILYLLQYVPLIQQLARQLGISWPSMGQGGAAHSGSGQESVVQARYVRMAMDHRSGRLRGEVLEGQFAGRQLHDMSLEELAQLFAECQSDSESATLVQAYLDRVHGSDWQARARTGKRRQDGTPGGSKMSMEEAYQVLGLKSGSSRDEVVAAHRRLMQKVHPDRGGSDYLAAKLNQAKDVLLKA